MNATLTYFVTYFDKAVENGTVIISDTFTEEELTNLLADPFVKVTEVSLSYKWLVKLGLVED